MYISTCDLRIQEAKICSLLNCTRQKNKSNAVYLKVHAYSSPAVHRIAVGKLEIEGNFQNI